MPSRSIYCRNSQHVTQIAAAGGGAFQSPILHRRGRRLDLVIRAAQHAQRLARAGRDAHAATHTTNLINNDDPHTPRISIPVQMSVAEAASILDVAVTIAGFEVTFAATVTGTMPLTYTWSFGDGGTSSFEDPTHVYAHGGCYTPTLTVSNECSEDTWQEQICLYRPYYLPMIVKSF